MPTRTYGLVGHPVKHSLSPAMQHAAFAACGIDAVYTLYDIAPDRLDAFLDDVPGAGICGLNVTIPHKIRVKEYLERRGTLDDNARRLGAVNTIQIGPGGALKGFNTDGPGFYRSLVEDLRCEPEGKTVFVLGAGGAAQAVVMYLGNGPKKIFITDVDTAKTAQLKIHYGRYFDAVRLEVVGRDTLRQALGASDLIINATPVGMHEGDPSPVDKALLRHGLYVYDLVYNRPMTQLVKDATLAKCYATTGWGMLLRQGAIAFELWTGEKAPVEAMKKALKAALKGM